MRKKLLSFIKEYIQIHGYAPSVQEMVAAPIISAMMTKRV